MRIEDDGGNPRMEKSGARTPKFCLVTMLMEGTESQQLKQRHQKLNSDFCCYTGGRYPEYLI